MIQNPQTANMLWDVSGYRTKADCLSGYRTQMIMGRNTQPDF